VLKHSSCAKYNKYYISKALKKFRPTTKCNILWKQEILLLTKYVTIYIKSLGFRNECLDFTVQFKKKRCSN